MGRTERRRRSRSRSREKSRHSNSSSRSRERREESRSHRSSKSKKYEISVSSFYKSPWQLGELQASGSLIGKQLGKDCDIDIQSKKNYNLVISHKAVIADNSCFDKLQELINRQEKF